MSYITEHVFVLGETDVVYLCISHVQQRMGNLTAIDACYAMVKNRLKYNYQETAKSGRSTLDMVEVVQSLSYKAQ